MTGKHDPASPSSKPANERQKVHIQITYTGKGQPATKLKERCDTLVDMLVEADAGVIDGRKAGDGAVDIFVVTRFADHTIENARRIITELGLETRATVKLADAKAEG